MSHVDAVENQPSVSTHVPVLLAETLDGLDIKPDGVYLDATFGRGGHSAAILERLGDNGKLYAIDQDPAAIEQAQRRFGNDRRFFVFHTPFSKMQSTITEPLDGVLMDIGVSSPQLDDAERGFSFMRDGPLDMRMDTTQDETAATWLNTARESDIADVLYKYGEERFRGRIATAIVKGRPLFTTHQLAKIIADVIPKHEPGKHPATRSFQAIRIYVNQELTELEQGLRAASALLKVGGKLSVISFHSLEDRMVKRFIRDSSRIPDVFTPQELRGLPVLKKQGKPITAGDAELQDNVRARSAVLRVAERLQ